jgi:hypothetical protein
VHSKNADARAAAGAISPSETRTFLPKHWIDLCAYSMFLTCSNLSDDIDGSSTLPSCAGVRVGWQAPNAETGEGNSRFSGF